MAQKQLKSTVTQSFVAWKAVTSHTAERLTQHPALLAVEIRFTGIKLPEASVLPGANTRSVAQQLSKTSSTRK
ncbi:hypothetical protein AM1BK_19930 [Neobacillus kokaensis]|uniref:Uncharacterized protein n=1 Tax=Neobacillus kokaensis TaxID=2759023 RepID=A0ABQ3N0J5_9BACI|nr:hypothetical protein AM1BK_19930 [Neobacillus kokaensis]